MNFMAGVPSLTVGAKATSPNRLWPVELPARASRPTRWCRALYRPTLDRIRWTTSRRASCPATQLARVRSAPTSIGASRDSAPGPPPAFSRWCCSSSTLLDPWDSDCSARKSPCSPSPRSSASSGRCGRGSTPGSSGRGSGHRPSSRMLGRTRFAQFIGFVITALALTLFAVDVDVAGYGLTALACALTALNASTGLCLGCKAYVLIRRRSRPDPAVRGHATGCPPEARSQARPDRVTSPLSAPTGGWRRALPRPASRSGGAPSAAAPAG